MMRIRVALFMASIVTLAGVGLLMVTPGSGTAEPALAGTLLHSRNAPDFRLVDQFQRPSSLSQFRRHPVVVTFLAAHCRETCPLVADKIREAVSTLGRGGQQISILVISTDPEGDTSPAVRQFLRTHGMLYRWHYLVGSRRQLSRVWHEYYIYAAPKGAPPALRDGHTTATYLIDSRGREQVLLTGVLDELVLVRDLQILAGLPVTLAASTSPAPQVQHPAPDFMLPGLAGTPITLKRFRGKVVLVNFWATYCPPCRTGMPMLAGWYHRLYGQGFVVLGVDQQESRGDVGAFLQRLHIRYPIALDESGAVSARYNVVDLPTSFLVDRSGTIQSVHIGMLTADYLRRQVMPLLKAQVHD
jgi:cytochrome c biogenesis protein CcmG, thiol:disulfide interchange protein DsbE